MSRARLDDRRHKPYGRRATDRVNGSKGQIAVLMTTVTLAGMLVTGVSGYYVHQAALERRIAEVREQYATKDELRRSVDQHQQRLDEAARELKAQNEKLEDVKRSQAVQEQILRDIKQGLERDRRPRP